MVEKMTSETAGKLYDSVDRALDSGASRELIIEKILLSGIDIEKAEFLVDTVIAARKKNALGWKTLIRLIRYLTFSIVGFLIAFVALTLLFDASELTKIAKYTAWFFLAIMVISGNIVYKDGKRFAYMRFGLLHLLWVSAALLSGLLFMEEPWAFSSLEGSGGGPRGAIFSAAANFVIHVLNYLGPVGSALIFVIISFTFLVVTFIQSNDIKEGNFKAN